MNSRHLFISILSILIGSIPLWGQIAPDTYWIQFKDKNHSAFSLDQPQEFLSDKAIARRINQNIPYDSSDLPVSRYYVDSLLKLGLDIRNISKWFNGVVVQSVDYGLLDTIHHISFIANSVREKSMHPGYYTEINKFDTAYTNKSISYGYSEAQIKMIKGDALHSSGYTGKDIIIGVLDAGFSRVDNIESLEHLWTENRILAWKDFVKDGKPFFLSHSHGTKVLSIMAGIIPDNIFGSAPHANYVLLRTENGASEYLVEEYNWACGAEFADSIGVDVINSSLGYSVFNDTSQNHTYEDMDGRTTVVSRAALMAARKGILISCSAGNSGGDINWGYITAPGDADSILTVGAVDTNLAIAYFSGRGPSSDRRVKPDVCAMGVNTISQSNSGTIQTCTGTSCSSPVIAGLSACLWQANPNATAQEIKNAIQISSHLYSNPDTIFGYGIPDFQLANLILQQKNEYSSDLTKITIVPNPVTNYCYLVMDIPWLLEKSTATIGLYDLNGRVIYNYTKSFFPGSNINALNFPENLDKGNYILKISIKGRYYNTTFIKL
jgi:subtilisin family serine protease